MTNTLAIFLGGLILAILAVDWFYFDWSLLVILGEKLWELIEYIAFWR